MTDNNPAHGQQPDPIDAVDWSRRLFGAQQLSTIRVDRKTD